MVEPSNTSRTESLERLRTFIETGDFGPGDRLPSERDLIELIGIKRSALRHALETLERDGVIWRHVGKGTFVSDRGPRPPADEFDDIGKHLTPVQMIRARLCIEPAIAKEAAINASTEAIERIRRAKDRNEAAVDWTEYQASDDAFHHAVATATGNMLLLALFERLNQVKHEVTFGNVSDDTRLPQIYQEGSAEHAQIYDAIRARDPAMAQDSMRRHIASVAARQFGET